MQKFEEFKEVINNPSKPFSQYDWAFNAEATDSGILAEHKDKLEKGGLSENDRVLSEYIVNRDNLRRVARTNFTVGQISNAIDEKNEDAELLGWFRLFGLDDNSESIEGILARSCGDRSKAEALKYFRESYKPFIDGGDEEKAAFEKMDDVSRRKFIGNLRKGDLTEKVDVDYNNITSAYDVRNYAEPTRQREMTDEEYSKWSEEYLLNTKYRRFWNAVYFAGEKNAKIALSLSMSQDEDAVKAYIPQIQSLSMEDRAEIYRLAYEFNPEVPMYRLIKDEFIDSWKDIPRMFQNARDFLTTSASDLKQYVDSHGGLDAIMSDEKAKDEFRNKFFVAEHAVFVGVNRFALPFGRGDEALRDYSEQIYKVGAQMLENRARFDELQQALQTKYTSHGEVLDGVVQGVSFGIQFGQFVLINAVSGGTGAVAGAVSKAAKAGKLANFASKASNISFKVANASSGATKLATPYFAAMMQVDAQKAAQDAGLDDDKAFMVGTAVGLCNTFLERLQFAARQKNPFLLSKIADAFQKRGEFTKQVMLNSAIEGAKRRAGVFGEEYLVENLQNVVQDVGVYLAGKLNETEMREFNEIANGLLEQSAEMIIPLFTATNIGAGAIPFKALQTFATAERLKGDEKAVHDFNARFQLEEALSKIKDAKIDALNPDVALKYANAKNDAQKAKILLRLGLSSKERARAKEVLEDVKSNIEEHSKELIEKIKSEISSKTPLMLEAGEENQGSQKVFEKKLLGIKNQGVIDSIKSVTGDFVNVYSLGDEVRILNSTKDLSENEISEIARGYARENNVSLEAGRRFVLERMDGLRFNGKIYIVADKAKTPKRALEILKHETGHRGAEEIREKKGFKSFLDGLLDEHGGEDFVRIAISEAKGGAYKNLGKYDLAEEFMCMLAEKVKGKNELSKQELSAWQKIKDFFTTVLSGIPKEENARDMFIANAIRSLWKKNYGVDDDGGLDIAGEYVSESAKPKETSYSQKRKAKKSFEQKMKELKLKEKKLSESELELERERLEFERFFNSIPEDDITNRLEALRGADIELLSDEHLEYAAYNGEGWAEEEFNKREAERMKKYADSQTDSLLDVMAQNGIKLPTPNAIIKHCKRTGLPLSGTLFGEINDLFNSLNFYQQQKYFTSRYSDIDEVANVLMSEHGFPYEGSADFLSDFAENVWGKKDTRFSAVDVQLLDKKGNYIEDNRPNKPNIEMSTGAVIYDIDDNFDTSKDGVSSYLQKYIVNKGVSLKTPFGVFDILFRWNDGLRHDIWFGHRLKKNKAQSFRMLPELIANAKFVAKDNVKQDKNNLKTKDVFHLYSLLKTGDDKYDIVRIVLKGTQKGKYVYEHIIHEESSAVREVLSRIKAIASQKNHTELLPIQSQNISENQEKNTENLKFSFRDTRSAAELEAERQIEEVRAKWVDPAARFEKKEGYMKAPNGKPTKLTERQWLQVRTPNFKKWFGDWENDPQNASKVVDENGEPLVVYHGTTNTNSDYSRFTVFGKTDKGRRTSGGMHFFSSSRDVAGSMGSNVYDVFIFSRNPLVIDSAGNEFGAIRDHTGGIVKFKDLTPAQKKKLCKAFDFTPEELEESYKPEDDIDLVQAGVIKRPEKSSNEWAKYAKENGYDGVIFKNLRDGADLVAMQTPSDVFVVFDSNQIKSATDNVGTFDSENPDIRWSFIDIQKPDASNFDFTEEERALYEAAVVPKYTYKSSTIALAETKKRLKIPNVVKNTKLNLSGILSAGTLNEMKSDRSMSKTKFTSNAEVHTVALANVEELFKGAIFDVVSPDKNGKLKNMHRLYVPMFYNNKVYGVQITVKESKNEITIGDKSSNNKIYSIEAIDVENLFAKTPQEWEAEYKRRNKKYLKKEDFEMGGELIVPKSERPDTPNSYELFSKSARSFLEDILNVNKKIAAKNVSAKFSAIDSDFETRKRKAAVLLAEKIYAQAGQNYNPENGNSEAFNPTEEQLQEVYMSEMDFLDDDIEEIANRAMAIAYKMASRGGNIKNIREEARNIEDEFHTAKIVEACIKDAQRKWQKDLQASEKAREMERRNLEAEKRGITPWSADELAIDNINILGAITEDADVKEEIKKLLEKSKAWADKEGVSYDLMLEKFKITLGANIEDAASQFVRYRHIKSALSGIQKILESATEDQARARAEKLLGKLKEYFLREVSAFEEARAKKAEKEELKKKREAEKREESRLKKAHARAVKMLKKFARSQKLPKYSELEIKRKLPARIQAYLAQIKKVMPLSAEEVKSRFQYLSEKKGKLEVDGEDLNYKERYEMSALQFFGNIDGKTLPELLEIRAKLKELIEGQMDEQAKRLEALEEEIARAASPLTEALELSPNMENIDESGAADIVKRGVKGVSMLEHRLRNVFLAKKGMNGDLRKVIEEWIAEYSQEMSRASIEERRFKNSEMEWLKNTLRQVYKNKFKDSFGSPIEDKVIEYLSKPDKNFAKFADIDAGGRVLSRGQLMQIVASLEQWEVKEAWKEAQERMERLEKNGEDIPEKFEEQYAYWKRLFDFKPEMESLLSAEDKALIGALKQKYRERLEIVNPVYERYNGLPMISSGLNYLPLVREGELNIESGGESNAINLFPEYYAPRQISLKKLDEGANILQVFQNRTETDAHFIHFADLIFQTKEILADKNLKYALKTRLPKKETDTLLSALRDPLKGRIERKNSVNDAAANMVSTWTAYFGLAFNLTSAAKQPTSFPAFMLQVPAKEWFGGFMNAFIHPAQFFSDALEVWRSPYLQDRRKDGEINQVLADIERESKKIKDENSIKKALRRFFLKWAFAPIKVADSAAFVIGGTVVYQNLFKKYSEVLPENEAKRLAAIDMLSIGEMTQQSSFIMNMSESQRRDGGLGRMFSLFRTTNQQYLSFEVNAWKEFYTRRDAESAKRFVKTFLLNHVILPALFNGMGILQNFLLGDDWDDDDWKILLGNTAVCGFLDVYTGWWFSSVLKGIAQTLVFGGQNAVTDTMLPANAVSRLSAVAFSAIREIKNDGFSDEVALNLMNNVLKTTFSPYRIGAKLYKNATDGQEGVLW